MINQELLNQIESISSILTVLISLIGFSFIYYQIRQINKSIKSNTNNYVYARTDEIVNFLLENDIREYFYSGKNPPKKVSKELNQKLIVACEKISYSFEFIFLEQSNYHKGIFNNWTNYMSFVYHNSPVLRAYLHNRKSWYFKGMIEYFTKENHQVENQNITQLTGYSGAS